jgi:hypothetical protein
LLKQKEKQKQEASLRYFDCGTLLEYAQKTLLYDAINENRKIKRAQNKRLNQTEYQIAREWEKHHIYV